MRLNMIPNARYSLYILASALINAMSLILTEIGLSGYNLSPLTVAIITGAVGGIFLLVYYRKHAEISKLRKPSTLVPLAVAAVSTYGLASLYGYIAVQQIGAGQAALLGLLETPFIILLGLIFLKEKLSGRGWVAASLALTGAFVITFDPTALRLTWTPGEFYAVLNAFLIAVGIVASRQAFKQLHAGWTSGLLLVLGSVVLLTFLPATGSETAFEISLAVAAILALTGLLRGLVWLLFNSGVQQIGASAAAILFLSHSFFTVALQVVITLLFPNVGLQPPGNLILSLVGGVLIACGVALWETQPQSAAQPG